MSGLLPGQDPVQLRATSMRSLSEKECDMRLRGS